LVHERRWLGLVTHCSNPIAELIGRLGLVTKCDLVESRSVEC